MNIEFDEILIDPIDVVQLDQYIGGKFKRGASFYAARKSSDRRDFFDRRGQSNCRRTSDADRVISDEEIIDYLWPGNSHATKADLHQYMYLLRKKIEENPKKPMWITTVKGFGYRLLV